MVDLWYGIGPNFPDKQLPVSAQAEQVVPKDQQLQDGSCMPLVAPMPSQKWTGHNHPFLALSFEHPSFGEEQHGNRLNHLLRGQQC